MPVVEILSCADPADLTTCTNIASLTNIMVSSDTMMTGTLPGGMTGLPPETYAIRVTNPEVPPCTGTL